jgi:hypothetical protein
MIAAKRKRRSIWADLGAAATSGWKHHGVQPFDGQPWQMSTLIHKPSIRDVNAGLEQMEIN